MKILAFFAHPDDETMLAGGTLALLAHSGSQAHYLSATRGEGGELGEPPRCKVEELGDVRAEELACAVHALGGISLTCLAYADPSVGPRNEMYPFTTNLAMLSGQIAAKIREYQVDALITHGSNGEYGHPAHVLCHRAARLAVTSFGDQAPLMYTVQAAFDGHPHPRLANRDDPAHLILDVTPVIRYKTRAALCHRTQFALFVRRSSKLAGRQLKVPEVIMRVESLHRAIPPTDGEPDDPLARALRPWLLKT